MDKNSIIGLVLIAGILLTFSIMNKPDETPKKKDNTETTADIALEDSTNVATIDTVAVDTTVVEEIALAGEFDPTSIIGINSMSYADSVKADSLGRIEWNNKIVAQKQAKEASKTADYGSFYSSVNNEVKDVVLENDQLKITFSTQGAEIKKVELKEYQSHTAYVAGKSLEESALVLIDSTNEMGIEMYTTKSGYMSKVKSTRDIIFTAKQEDSKLTFTANGSEGEMLEYTYELGENYKLDWNVRTNGFGNDIQFGDLNWTMNGLNNEKSRSTQNQIAGVFYKYDGEGRTYLSEMTDSEEEIEGELDWIAFKQKFFSAILINKSGLTNTGDFNHKLYESGDYIKQYNATIGNKLGSKNNSELELSLYLGPNDYDILASHEEELEGIVNLGWGIFGWINRNFFHPLFRLLESTGMNYGIIILLLTLVVRGLTMPLLYKNYKSSAKMKLLKPEIDEISKKFPDKADAMKKQQATMALYKSTGVNPLAGCLPMLIQMPILFAMFRLVPSLIEIRQKPFLWAEDLSVFDSIAQLGFEIPFYGDHISLFTLLMAGATLGYTMINTGNMAPQQEGMPNMKYIMYFFPIMMIFFFNSYSSGLTYYYFISSLLSMGVMLGIKKYLIDDDKLKAQIAENKKKPRKKSKFAQRLEEMQKQQMAKQQQRKK